MNFERPLLEGTLVKRYKRFLADIELLNGDIVTAHCTNTGSMKEVLNAPQKAWILPNDNPNRKLKYTLEIVENYNQLIGVNTHRTNKLVEEALNNEFFTFLGQLHTIQREVKINDGSRLDFYVESEKLGKTYIEVKHVSLGYGTEGQFPDSVTERGTKHINELRALKKKGFEVVMLLISQRNDLTTFRPAWDIDPTYAQTLKDAVQEGVHCKVFTSDISPESVTIQKEIPLYLDPQ